MYPPKTADGYPVAAPPAAFPASAPDYTSFQPQGVAAFQVEQKNLQPWSIGLCSCPDDLDTCCITMCCPCIAFGRTAEIIDQGSTSCATSGALYTVLALFTGCQWIYACTYRSKLRRQYSLEEDPCNDCLVHLCCHFCAIGQEYRELQNRGFDMKIGWHANMAGRGQTAQTFPPSRQGDMIR